MDKVIRNYDVPEIKPMNTKEFARYLKNKLKEKKHKNDHNQALEEHVHGPECAVNEPPIDIEIIALAIVLDDVVVEVMNVQKGFADILLKGPKFVQINEGEERPNIGSIYKDGKFELFSMHGVTRRGAE
jgi:hypothetical protein